MKGFKRWIRNVMWQCWGSSGHHLDVSEGLIEITSSSSKMGRPTAHQITLLTGWESYFRTGWSAGSVTSSGYLIHLTWTPRFLTVGISEGPCVSEQSSNNWWAQGCNCNKNQGNSPRGVHASDWQFCATVASLFPMPRRSFGTYSREIITFVQSIQDYWNFWA